MIEIFKETFEKKETIIASIIYGSFARKQPGVNSDIDLVILKTNNFSFKNFLTDLENAYNQFKVIDVRYIKLRSKAVIYFEQLPKIEITFIDEIQEIERNFKGSLIPTEYITDTILFDKTNELQNSLKNWAKGYNNENITEIINDLVAKFIYEFESSSSSHSRSDGYKFYYFYNIAFHTAIQLKYLTKGNTDYYFLPKNFMTENIADDKKDEFYEISGTTYNRNANEKKRKLLDFFYEAIKELNLQNIDEITSKLEQIYKRDSLWNFRDLSKNNSQIKPNLIYRTSSLTSYQNEKYLLPYLAEKNIKIIIDLRAGNEIAKRPYENEFISKFNYVKAHLDPWIQPEWFKNELDDSLSNEDKAYYFFLKACKKELKLVFETILKSNNAIAIHCFAGKDRTGLVIMLISMLTNTSYNELLNDYLESEIDTTERKFKIYYDYIINFGGIERYLKSCELSDKQINKLKNKLRK